MKITECQCEKCRECCLREPGWFLPEQIPIAAQFLEMTEADFVQQYCASHDLDGATALSPARKKNSATCIFYLGGKCRIHQVKPEECKKVFGCEAPRRHSRARELIAREWR